MTTENRHLAPTLENPLEVVPLKAILLAAVLEVIPQEVALLEDVPLEVRSHGVVPVAAIHLKVTSLGSLGVVLLEVIPVEAMPLKAISLTI